jgi:hypothetical protein
MGCSGPTVGLLLGIKFIFHALCKLVGANLRPIWWLILMSISCISLHALFNSVVHGHPFRVSSPILQ